MSERVAVEPLRTTWPTLGAVAFYGVVIVVAEAVAAFAGPVLAAALHGGLLIALLSQYVVSGEDGGRVFAALALIPLLRLASLALSPDDVLAFYVLSGIPVLLAAVLAADALDLPGAVALWEVRHRSQWQPALAVLAPAVVAAPLLRLDAAQGAPLLLALPIVFVFAGVLEELVFRGVIQGALAPLIGGWSVAAADVLFLATYLGCGSLAYAAFMAGFGFASGWWVRRTGSIAGAAIGHGLLAAVLLVLWPVLQ